MSRSRPNTRLTSPVKHYFDWSPKDGKLSFWDKEAKKNILFPKLTFVVLDQLHTVAGFSKANNNGIRGSEVRDLKTPITVYIGKNKHTTDIYADLKNNVTGLKYAKAVYIGILRKGSPMEIAKIVFTGASFGAWLNFLNGKEEYEGKGSVDLADTSLGIKIVGKTKQKVNGSAKWYEPKFELFKISEEEDVEATALDEALQLYLDAREEGGDSGSGNETKAQTPATNATDDDYEEEEEAEEEHEDAEDVDDLPF